MSQIGRDQAGNLWEYDGLDANGEPINPRPAAQQGQPSRGTVYTPPPTPKAPREAPSGYRWDANGNLQVIPGGPADKPEPKSGNGDPTGVSAKTRADAIRQFYGANALTKKTGGLAGKYREGPGATKGFGGIQDMFPTEQNRQFDDAGLQLRGYVKDALGFTGGEGNTVGEVQLNYGPYLPEASDWDGRIEGKIGALYGLANDSRERAIATLGGVPGQDGKVYPVGSPEAQQILGSVGHGRVPNVWDQESIPKASVTAAAGSFGNAITGNTRMRQQNDPETAARAKQAWLSGASYDQVNQIFKDAGYPGISIGEWNAVEPWRKKGRGKEIVWETAREVPMSRAEELAGSPTGAALAGIANAGSFGGVQRLAPEQMQAIQAMNPKMSLAGEVIGSIGGTSMVGKLGQGIAGRLGGLGSKLATGGGRGGNLARGVGTDAAYAGIYGENTGQGALPSAGLGALGSIGGRVVGSGIGRTLGGVSRAPGADELVNRGIPLTTGQQLGGVAKSFEDRLTGVPMVGDIVNARRTDGFEGLQRSLQNDAGSPIGARFDGGDWREALPDQFGQAYDDATAGVNVPLDPQFMPDLQNVARQSQQLPPDLSQRFASAMDNRVQPIANAGEMTGESYQQAMRGLSGYKAEMTKPGFEQDYRGALSGAQDVLKSQMMRGGGDQVVEGLGKADKAYRMAKVIQDAQTRAAGGSLSGVPGLPAPSQFLAASTANAKKFDGKRPFGQILDAAQQVMPSKIGDSGTAGRLAQMALPAALVGGGGTGYATGGDASSAAAGTLTPLAIAGLLALGGTKGGQSAINAALFKRPAALKSPATRRRLGKLQGLFGAASVPLMLEFGN